MKYLKVPLLIAAAMFFLNGCEQISNKAAQVQDAAQKQIGDIQTQVETTKNQILDTKAKIDEKVTQAQDAANAIQKLAQ